MMPLCFDLSNMERFSNILFVLGRSVLHWKLLVKLHPLWGGQHGKGELVFGIAAFVFWSGKEWAVEVSGVLCSRSLDQRECRCVSSPPPLLWALNGPVFIHDLSRPLLCTAHISERRSFLHPLCVWCLSQHLERMHRYHHWNRFRWVFTALPRVHSLSWSFFMGGSKSFCHCLGRNVVLCLRQVYAHACLLTLLQGRCGELWQTGQAFSVGAGWVEVDGWKMWTAFTNISAGGISFCFCFCLLMPLDSLHIQRELLHLFHLSGLKCSGIWVMAEITVWLEMSE